MLRKPVWTRSVSRTGTRIRQVKHPSWVQNLKGIKKLLLPQVTIWLSMALLWILCLCKILIFCSYGLLCIYFLLHPDYTHSNYTQTQWRQEYREIIQAWILFSWTHWEVHDFTYKHKFIAQRREQCMMYAVRKSHLSFNELWSKNQIFLFLNPH